MSTNGTVSELSIGDIATLTGVSESALRMWESRYAFPSPRRLPSGHRRYTPHDLDQIRLVLRAREEGLPLPRSIDRARRLDADPRPSIYRALRDQFAHLDPHLLTKPSLRWLSRAIEDECSLRAPAPLLFGCFQRERYYRQSERRWRELARTAERALVLADFHSLRRPADAPAEVPLDHRDPLLREWVVVCDAPQLAACLVAWERPPQPAVPAVYEALFSVEPEVAREAARLCCELAARRAPEIVADLRDRLADVPSPAAPAHLRLAVEITARVAAYAGAG